MKFAQIFVLHMLFALAATDVESDKCKKKFDRSFTVMVAYYKALFRNCEQISNVQRLRAEADSQEQYKLLTSGTFQNCYTLQQCDRVKEEIAAYDCFLTQILANSDMFLNISFGATQYSLALTKRIHLIDAEEYKCTNETIHKLTVEATQGVTELINCNNKIID